MGVLRGWGRRGRDGSAHRRCRSARFEKFIHPYIHHVETVSEFRIQRSLDAFNILPNERELTCLDVIDSILDGHTPDDFLSELGNGLSIPRVRFQQGRDRLFGLLSQSREGRQCQNRGAKGNLRLVTKCSDIRAKSPTVPLRRFLEQRELLV
jgi:hypothetical protein